MTVEFPIGAADEPPDLPTPMTPPECDLRGLPWMQLWGDRLFESDTWLEASSDGKVAMLPLWWAAWKQKPAGSLPTNDRVLAQFAGCGNAVDAWLRVKGEALRGFVLCNDGRLYHSFVCELALAAWQERQKNRERQENWRKRRAGNDNGDHDVTVTSRSHNAQRGRGRGREKGIKNQIPSESDSPLYPPAGDASPSAPPVKAARNDRGTLLPADWKPGEDDRQYAQRLGLDVRRVVDDFKSYWLSKAGKDARKRDWSLTWQGWCRREADRRSPRPPGTSPPSAPPVRNGFAALLLNERNTSPSIPILTTEYPHEI